MSRRGKPRRLKGSQATGHSAIANGWFIPSGKSVEQVELKARELWQRFEAGELEGEKIVGRIEGMAMALAILKKEPDGTTRKASAELRRIKYGQPGTKEQRAGMATRRPEEGDD